MPSFRAHRSVVLCIAPSFVTALLACTSAGCGGDDDPDTDTGVTSLEDVTFTPTSAHNVRITWKATADSEVVIERKGPGGAFSEVGRRAGDHARFLDLALEPETTYAYRLRRCRQGKCESGYATGQAATPATEFPEVTLTVAPNGTDDDVVLFGAYRISASLYTEAHMVGVDRHGTVVWEYAGHELGPITEVEALPDRTIATGQNQYLVQIDLDGTEVYRWTGGSAHHDIDRLPDGRFAFLFFDAFETEPGYTRLGDGIHILNPEGSAVEWEWRARDYIPLSDFNEQDLKDQELGLGHDWTHSNAIDVSDDGSKVLLNVRNLNRIYRIDVATKEVDWIMGDGGDFGAGLWDHSHDPEFLDDHHVLILDNGLRRPEPKFSRVIEVAFDADAKTAEMIWEYRETPDFYSLALGFVQQQGNGNIFIADGMNGRLLEVTRDKQKVWELRVEKYYWIYKAVTVPRSFFAEW